MSCYYYQIISETRVTIARYDKKQDLDIIIPTFVVPKKLMLRYKAQLIVIVWEKSTLVIPHIQRCK